jgi:hypothetical protein
MDVGIDFVRDPVVFKEEGQEHARDPKNPTARDPRRTGRRTEERNVHQIGRGIADVRKESESGHGEERRKFERGTEMGPRADEPDDADGGEEEVVEDAARFPEACRGGEEFEEAGCLRSAKGWRGHKNLQNM